MKVIVLENLSIIDKIQLHSFNKGNDFGSVKMKSMIKVWNDLIEEKIDYRESYDLWREVWFNW